MSRFQAIRPESFLKSVLPAAAFACSLALANPGHATAYFLQSDSMNTSRTAHIYGPGGFDVNAYIGPVKFTAFEGTGATPQTGALGGALDLIGFCVDIFHDIGLGALNLKYDDTYDLATDSKYLTTTPFSGGTALSSDQITQVGRLVNYGSLLYANGPNTADTVNRLAGLQGAIWQVVNPGYSVVSSTAAVNGYITNYSAAGYSASLTGYGPVNSDLLFLTETGKYGTKAAHQSFAFGAAPAPEPGTWSLMIIGFGLMGAMVLAPATRARPRPQLAEDVNAAGAVAGGLGQAADLQPRLPRAAHAAQPRLEVLQDLAAQPLGDPGPRVDHSLASTAAARPQAGARLGGPAEPRLPVGPVPRQVSLAVRHGSTPCSEQKQNF